MTPSDEERAEEKALDLFFQIRLQSEDEWRRRIALELCKANAEGYAKGVCDSLAIAESAKSLTSETTADLIRQLLPRGEGKDA